MEKICYELADNLSKICFIVHSMQRIFADVPEKDAQEDLEAATDILKEIAENSLKSLRKVL